MVYSTKLSRLTITEISKSFEQKDSSSVDLLGNTFYQHSFDTSTELNITHGWIEVNSEYATILEFDNELKIFNLKK